MVQRAVFENAAGHLWPVGRQLPIPALDVAEVEGQLVSAQTICHTLQQVGLHGRHPRRKPLLKLAHKKACKQFAEDNLAKSMNYWNHVLWSDESKVLVWVRWCPVVLCSKYRYDDVSSQRFDDTSIDTAGPVSILWHVCSSVDCA